MEKTATFRDKLTVTLPNNLIDYTNGHFMMEIVRGEIKVYASVNEVFYHDHCGGGEGLAPCGNYFVYLLHPTRGSLHFTLEFDDELGRWDIPETPSKISDEFLNETYKPLYNDAVTKVLVGEDIIREISDKIKNIKM
ncbi:MAG: hypothetical protein ABI675_30960 [Chitinophagaceae bacterium]